MISYLIDEVGALKLLLRFNMMTFIIDEVHYCLNFGLQRKGRFFAVRLLILRPKCLILTKKYSRSFLTGHPREAEKVPVSGAFRLPEGLRKRQLAI